MKQIKVYHVDAFTTEPFGGNPAGVVPEADGLTELQMQQIARELNLSETAFLVPSSHSQADYRVRFFTPAREIDFFGHATVASSWILGTLYGWADQSEEVRLETNIGVIPVKWMKEDHVLQAVIMTQASPKVAETDMTAGDLASILGLHETDLDSSLPLRLAYTGNWHLIVPVKSRAAIDSAKPDLAALEALNRKQNAVTTHLYTWDSGLTGYDLYTRDFAPALGIPEDPVTGAANGALAGYLLLEGLLPVCEKYFLTIAQGHAAGRPGTLFVTIIGAQGNKKPIIQVGGSAVPTISGILTLP